MDLVSLWHLSAFLYLKELENSRSVLMLILMLFSHDSLCIFGRPVVVRRECQNVQCSGRCLKMALAYSRCKAPSHPSQNPPYIVVTGSARGDENVDDNKMLVMRYVGPDHDVAVRQLQKVVSVWAASCSNFKFPPQWEIMAHRQVTSLPCMSKPGLTSCADDSPVGTCGTWTTRSKICCSWPEQHLSARK